MQTPQTAHSAVLVVLKVEKYLDSKNQIRLPQNNV